MIPDLFGLISYKFSAGSLAGIHTILEAVSIVIAIICALLARALFKIKDQMIVGVLGVTLLVSGCIDTFSLILGTMSDIGLRSDILEPITWTVSRLLNAGLYLVGGILIVVRNQKSFGKQTHLFVGVTSGIIIISVGSLLLLLLKSEPWHFFSFSNQHFWNPLIGGVYWVGFWIYLRIYQKTPSLFSGAILYSFLPILCIHVSMALASGDVYDRFFFIAHFFKVISYVIPLIGIQQELLKSYAQLQSQNLEITKISHYKTEFIANVSHEIRTPIHGIMGMINLLAKSRLNQAQRRLLELIQNSTECLSGLINDILDLSKSESGNIILESIPVNIRDICDQSVNTILIRALEKKLPVYVNISPLISHLYITDPTRLGEVLVNILSNAIKFTNKGHVSFSVRIEADFTDQSHLAFVISDTGIGIDSEKLDILFQPFTQADASTTRKFGGTGLGLYICKKIIDQMGGKIEVSSLKEQGSNFKVLLPLQKAEPIPDLRLNNGPIPHVFVVNSDRLLDPILEDYLSALGTRFTKISAKSLGTRSFIEQIKTEKPTHILINLKSKSVLQNLNRRIEGVPIVIFSNGWKKEAWSSNIPVLETPITLNKLRKKLGSTIKPDFKKKPHQIAPFLGDILIVDDNSVNQLIAKEMVEALGFRAILASSGKEGLAVVEKFHYKIKLILMDIQMPEMDGMTSVLHLRTLEKERGLHPLPVIAVSASMSENNCEAYLAVSMSDCLIKPFNRRALETIIQKWIR